jgi:hypothetical protein
VAGRPEIDLDVVRRAVKNMDYLAWRADMEGVPVPPPGPNYGSKRETMTGTIRCETCGLPIRSHGLTEWHPAAGEQM